MSILKGKTSFLWSLVCLESPLIYRVSENCIKMICSKNRTFPILSEDTETIIQVMKVQESTAKF